MLQTPLRGYQTRARDAALAVIRHGGGFALFPEPRCGKTLIALSIVAEIRPQALLIVCPKNAIRVWNEEIKKHLKPGTLGVIAQVINYEQLTTHRKEWYKRARAYSRLMVPSDESHYIKKRGTARSGVVRHIGGFAKYRLALTGTPIAQGIQDAWAQFDFLDPSIFGTWDEFSNKYLIWGGFKNKDIIKYRDEEDFNRKFRAYSYRITLREARKEFGTSLRLRYTKKTVILNRATRNIYDALQRELETVVNNRKIKVKNVLACITKLQQITGGFMVTPVEEKGLPDYSPTILIGQEKLEKLHEAVRSVQARTKFIVVCRFIHEIDAVHKFLARLGYGIKVVLGGAPYDGNFDCDAIVMQIQSGIAVDMSKADTVIFYSTDYSYLNFEQSRFRILSYNKTVTGHYIFLLASGTNDEVVYEAITKKKNLARLVIDTYRTREGR